MEEFNSLLRWKKSFWLLCLLCQSMTPAFAEEPQHIVNNPTDGSVLPYPPRTFKGNIGLSAKDSTPDFPAEIKAPKNAPNILIILLDDVGFGASSTFGGPINTPTLDWLANNGLRYNRFHTTALCSPTRAALLTGDNHHSAHSGVIMEAGTGYPGYDTLMGKDTATIAQILRHHGWNTAWFGKNHNVPDWETSQAGPYDRWPTHLGFDYFYGFVGGDTNQWRPNLYQGTHPIEPYIGNPNYNLDYDLADQAIKYIQRENAVAPEKPFFIYYAPGATHAPHHPRKEWVEKYKGKFNQGWDKAREEILAQQKKLGIVPEDTQLTPRQKDIPAWSSLNPDQKRLYSHMMEVYAGFLEQTDYNVGRIVDALKDSGQLDNTIIIYIVGDNGASTEGGLQGVLNEMTYFNGISESYQDSLKRIDEIGSWKTYNHYPVGWAWAMVAPFQWEKQIASHFGGTRNGMVVFWPKGIKEKGGIRSQFTHVIDITPTILDITGIKAPYIVDGVAQKPIEGFSMAYSFNEPNAPSVHRTQYFEMLGNRAIYNDGWVAATTPAGAPWVAAGPDVDPINGYQWELYHIDKDFSESKNLASLYPKKLEELKLLFYTQAAKYNVLPIDNSKIARLDTSIRPSLTRGRTLFTYANGITRIPEGAAPDIKSKSFRIVANITIPEKGAEGMIITQGGLFGGWGLYIKNDKPIFDYNFVGMNHYTISSPKKLSAGTHTLTFNFKYDGNGIGKGGIGTLSVDGDQVASGRIDKTIPIRLALDEGLDVGSDTGTPVNLSYDVPFHFTGDIKSVTVNLAPTEEAPNITHLNRKKTTALNAAWLKYKNPEKYPQLFPSHLKKHSYSKNKQKMDKNCYIKAAYLNNASRLLGLNVVNVQSISKQSKNKSSHKHVKNKSNYQVSPKQGIWTSNYIYRTQYLSNSKPQTKKVITLQKTAASKKHIITHNLAAHQHKKSQRAEHKTNKARIVVTTEAKTHTQNTSSKIQYRISYPLT